MICAVQEHFPEGTRVTRPTGGHVLWVELHPRADALRLHRRALEEGISVLPGPLFSPTGRYRNFLRLNYAVTWNDRIERAVARLGGLAQV